jgi:hypothetical protein
MASHQHPTHEAKPPSLNRTAWAATLHCLTGCAIGEVLGMALGTALAWHNGTTVVVSVVLAFVFGYGLTIFPLLKSGMAWRQAAGLALASDTASITIMEIVDNAFMVLVPGAMTAQLSSALFWLSLAASLIVAAAAAFPVNRWLISRGLGHAVLHKQHMH